MTRFRLPVAIGLLFAAAVAPFAIAQQSERAKRIGSKLLCMCDCNQILTQCNHVGCTMSSAMLKKLDQQTAGGDSDDLIAQSFVQEFGPKVLAEPPNKGFSRVAWWIPAVALAAGLALVASVLSRWRRRPRAVAGGGSAPDISPESLERARRQADLETEE